MPSIFQRWAKKTPLSQIPLWRTLSTIMNILETATGIDRGTGAGSKDGYGWHFGARAGAYGASSSEDYTETDVTIYCSEFKINAKLLSLTDSGSPPVTTYHGFRITGKTDYTAAEKRLLLQVTEPSTGTFTLVPAKGYLKT